MSRHLSFWQLAVPLLLAGLALRIAGLGGDLWLDEIWTVYLLKPVQSLPAALAIQNPNSHPLNSAYLYLIGTQAPFWLMRLPAMVASSAALLLIAANYRRLGTNEAFFSLLLMACSYPLVLYGSEARGYGLLILFALSAYFCSNLLQQNFNCRTLLAWHICLLAGLLSHFSFAEVYCAILVADVVCYAESAGQKRLFVLKHLPALAILPLFYFFFYVKLPPLTGLLRPYADVCLNTLSVFAGGRLLSPASPRESVPDVFIAVTVLALLCFALIRAAKRSLWQVTFYAAVMFLMPLAAILVTQPVALAERYFLMQAVFGYLLMGLLLADLWRRQKAGKLLTLLLCALFLAGNASYLLRFCQNLRGQYKAALTYMLESGPAPVSVTSQFGFRDNMVIEFYKSLLPGGEKIRYTPADASHAGAAQWYLAQTQDPRYTAPAIRGYKLEKVFPHTALSGWTWLVYRKERG